MHQSDSRNYHDPGGQAVAGQFDWLGQDPTYVEHHRANPQCLLRQCVEVLVAGRVARGAGLSGPYCLGQCRRVPAQALQRPGQSGGGGVVPGDQQRHELVTQFEVGHGTSVFIGGADQHGQHIGARGQVGVGATLGDLRVQQTVGFLDTPTDPPPRETALQVRTGNGQRRQGAHVDNPGNHFAQRGQPGRVGSADDGTQDDLKSDLGHPWSYRELGTHRPFGDVRRGDFGHHPGLARDGITLERGHHETAPVAVYVFVGHQHRAVADQPAQHRVRFAGMVDRRVARKHRLDVGGIIQVHQGPQRCDPQREHTAVAAPAGGHEAWPVSQHHCGLHRRGKRRSGR